jgi:hypothetical protein
MNLFDFLKGILGIKEEFIDYSQVGDVVDISKFAPQNDTMYLSKNAKRYLQLFRSLESKSDLYDKFFKITKVLPISSANGRVFIINSRTRDVQDSEVLVKVPLDDEADSLLYEYYIGMTLNNLRFSDRTKHFSLVYGKVLCGFDENDVIAGANLDDVKMCDNTKPEKIHLIYEYIRNPNTKKVTSFESYINRLKSSRSEDEAFIIERNIINILIILMYTLQIAQDTLNFTHYDLHLGNVLVVQLDEPQKVRIKYGGDEFYIVTNVMPYVIDYGRCYVDPSKVKSEQKFQDEYDNEYDTFKELQDFYFDGDLYISSDPRDCKDIEEQLAIFIHKVVYNRDLQRDSRGSLYYKDRVGNRNYDVYSDTPITGGMKQMIVDQIYNKLTMNRKPKYAYDNKGMFRVLLYNTGIKSNVYNSKYDFFKLTKTVLSKFLDEKFSSQLPYNLRYNSLWEDLDYQLNMEYPFYDNAFFSLPCDYHITDYVSQRLSENIEPSPFWRFWIKTPRDIGRILYEAIKSDVIIGNNSRRMIINHIGGDIRYKKMKSEQLFDKIKYDTQVETLKQTNIIDKTMDKTIDNKMDEKDQQENPVYIQYVESELLRDIKRGRKRDPLPERIVFREFSNRMVYRRDFVKNLM